MKEHPFAKRMRQAREAKAQMGADEAPNEGNYGENTESEPKAPTKAHKRAPEGAGRPAPAEPLTPPVPSTHALPGIGAFDPEGFGDDDKARGYKRLGGLGSWGDKDGDGK